MEFKSLGLRTDLMFHCFSAEVEKRDDYVVIRTPSRPDYLWGNCLIMSAAPDGGALQRWVAAFEREIAPRAQTGFMTFAWDDPSGAVGEIAPFLDFGFKLFTHAILTAAEVTRPVVYNAAFSVRPLESERDWDQQVEVQFSDAWGYGPADDQCGFIARQRDTLRDMVRAGLGLRFGAFLEDRLVAELGIYWDGEVVRFNNVATRVGDRRKGACSTLVYGASRHILQNTPCKTLVLEAVAGGPAARLYETAGFKPAQRLCKIEWLAERLRLY